MARDPLNDFRAIEQARKVMNPLGEYQRIMDRSKLVDPLGTRQIMDQARRVMNPLGEYQRGLTQTKPFDLLAGQREAMDLARKAMNPLGQAKPFDLLSGQREAIEQARKVMNPLGEYQRIMSDFSRLVGAPSLIVAAEDSEQSGSSSTFSMSFPLSPSHVLALLSAAWTCAWLIARGVDTQELGDLFFETVGLAIYFYEKSKQSSD